MSFFSRFLAKHSNELKAIARAIDVLQYSGALSPQDRAQIAETVSTVEKAAENIAASVGEVEKLGAVNVDTQALKVTVEAALPDLVAVAVAAALARPKRVRAKPATKKVA